MKKNSLKMLPESYNYYEEVSKKVKKISKKTFKEKNNDMLEQKLYNLAINICNQAVFDNRYTFTKDDLYFIADYDIDIHLVVNELKEDILKYKECLE